MSHYDGPNDVGAALVVIYPQRSRAAEAAYGVGATTLSAEIELFAATGDTSEAEQQLAACLDRSRYSNLKRFDYQDQANNLAANFLQGLAAANRYCQAHWPGRAPAPSLVVFQALNAQLPIPLINVISHDNQAKILLNEDEWWQMAAATAADPEALRQYELSATVPWTHIIITPEMFMFLEGVRAYMYGTEEASNREALPFNEYDAWLGVAQGIIRLSGNTKLADQISKAAGLVREKSQSPDKT